jgi:hypothetical protein
MGAPEFSDEDASYLAWLVAHPDDYVINIARGHTANEARVHHAGCRTISDQTRSSGGWTGPYVKVCGEHLAEVWRRSTGPTWARSRTKGEPHRSGWRSPPATPREVQENDTNLRLCPDDTK